MSKWKFFGMNEANAAIDAAEKSIDPALISAGVTQLTIKGELIALEKLSLSQKIDALISLSKPGEGAQKLADLIVTNDTLAKAAQESSEKLTVAQATVEALQRDKTGLESQVTTLTASVTDLTGKAGQSKVEFEAATNTISRLQKQVNDLNREVSRVCVASGCLELKGEDGKALAATATDEQKLTVADKISVTDKLNAHLGAVNSAVARVTGVPLSLIPNSGPAGDKKTAIGVLAQYEAIKDPQERQVFYRKNKDAIDACYRNPAA